MIVCFLKMKADGCFVNTFLGTIFYFMFCLSFEVCKASFLTVEISIWNPWIELIQPLFFSILSVTSSDDPCLFYSSFQINADYTRNVSQPVPFDPSVKQANWL